jgi:flagellar protein FliO/FliZ
MTVSLGVVLLVFGVAVMIAKKFAGSSKGFLTRNGKETFKPLEILSHKSLGPGKGLYLIRCLDQKILVGVTNTQISQIAEIQDLDDELEDNSFSKSMTTATGQRV